MLLTTLLLRKMRENFVYYVLHSAIGPVMVENYDGGSREEVRLIYVLPDFLMRSWTQIHLTSRARQILGEVLHDTRLADCTKRHEIIRKVSRGFVE
eukprot:507328-Hanusia_phi.AAC.2